MGNINVVVSKSVSVGSSPPVLLRNQQPALSLQSNDLTMSNTTLVNPKVSGNLYGSNGSLVIAANVEITGSLLVDGVFSLSGNVSFLNLTTNNIFANNITSNTLLVEQSANVINNLGVSNNLTVTGNNSIMNVVTISKLTVTGATVLATANVNSTLAVIGAATFSNTVNIANTLTVTNILGVLTISNSTTMSNTLTVVGSATLSNTLAVTGVTTLSNNAVINGTLTVNNSASFITLTSNVANIYDLNIGVTGNYAIANGILVNQNTIIITDTTTIAGSYGDLYLNFYQSVTLKSSANLHYGRVFGSYFSEPTNSSNVFVSSLWGAGADSLYVQGPVTIVGTPFSSGGVTFQLNGAFTSGKDKFGVLTPWAGANGMVSASITDSVGNGTGVSFGTYGNQNSANGNPVEVAVLATSSNFATCNLEFWISTGTTYIKQATISNSSFNILNLVLPNQTNSGIMTVASNGQVNAITSTTTATTPSSFSASKIVTINIGGTNYFIPASTLAW